MPNLALQYKDVYFDAIELEKGFIRLKQTTITI